MMMGMQVFGRAYDIFTARNLEDFESKSWFDCMHGATRCVLFICMHNVRPTDKDCCHLRVFRACFQTNAFLASLR
jgi:hypothetical protein